VPAPDYVWLPQATVDEFTGRQTGVDANRAALARTAAARWVERARPDLVDAFTEDLVDDDIILGAAMLAARLYSRKGSPDGLAGYSEFGAARISRSDPDIERLLGLGRHAPPRIG
jgi:hypothetical protein